MAYKQRYNELLQTYNKAQKYFARQDVPVEQKWNYEKQCKELVAEMVAITDEYKLTREEITNGFQ
jgi:hypothetical protein